MNIVILTSYFHPEITGIAPHATAIAKALHRRGHAVTVFAPQPHYPEWEVHAGYRGRRPRSEDMDGLTVHRSRIWLPRTDRVTLRTRLVGECSAVAFQGMQLLRHLATVARADIVIVMSPFFGQAITALALRALLRREFVFHVEDIIPDSAVDAGVLDQSRGLAGALVSFAAALERRVYRSARCVSTLTSAMRDNIRAKAPSAKVVMAGYWIDPDEHRPDEDLGAEFREAHGYDGSHLVLGYAGNIGAKQKLHALIDTATGRVSCASAGSPGVVVVRGNHWQSLGPTCPLLGESPEADFEPFEYTLQPGEALVIFTDAVRDAADAEGRPLRDSGMAEPLLGRPDLSADQLISIAQETLAAHAAGSGHDDRTILVVKRR